MKFSHQFSKYIRQNLRQAYYDQRRRRTPDSMSTRIGPENYLSTEVNTRDLFKSSKYLPVGKSFDLFNPFFKVFSPSSLNEA